MASGDGVNSQSEMASTASRLISSGIVRSRERSPASTWASGMLALRRDERARERRVDVTDDDDGIGLVRGDDLFEREHHRRCRLRVRTAATPR